MADNSHLTLQKCCDVALGLLDGRFGWLAEALSILFIVLFLNLFVSYILKRLCSKYEKEKKYLQHSFVKAFYKPWSYFTWFIAIVNSFDLINLRVNDSYFFSLSQMHLMLAISAVLCFAWFLLRWKSNVLQVMTMRSRNNEIAVEPGKIDMIAKLVTVGIIVFTILILLEITGRSMNTLIAFGGVGGLAIAIASQEIIANFFGGFMIYMTKPFAIGDWINLPERNLEGYVEEIGWYMTRIRTFEKRPIYVPNSTFSKIVVMTPSRMSHRRFMELIGIRYSDMPAARKIVQDIKEMIYKHEDIDTHQRIMVNLHSFGDYAVNILVDAYILRVDSVGYANVKEDILFKIADIVASNNAGMAFPTTSLDLPKDFNGWRSEQVRS